VVLDDQLLCDGLTDFTQDDLGRVYKKLVFHIEAK
jgi:hypothetical protein